MTQTLNPSPAVPAPAAPVEPTLLPAAVPAPASGHPLALPALAAGLLFCAAMYATVAVMVVLCSVRLLT